MEQGRAVVLAATAATLFAVGVAACNLVLGDHQIFGEDRLCSDDSDCGEDERCEEGTTLSVCRERCREVEVVKQCLQEDAGTQWDATAGQWSPAFRACVDGKYCTEPIGTPCECDEYLCDTEQCGGYAAGVECVNLDAEDNETLGYCTNSCLDASAPCPAGFVCNNDGQCRCLGHTCP